MVFDEMFEIGKKKEKMSFKEFVINHIRETHPLITDEGSRVCWTFKYKNYYIDLTIHLYEEYKVSLYIENCGFIIEKSVCKGSLENVDGCNSLVGVIQKTWGEADLKIRSDKQKAIDEALANLID